MDILIIGGSGHVSGSLARTALNKGHNVWTVTRGQKPIDSRAEPIIADRHDTELFKSAIKAHGKNWDMVVDCICYEAADMQQDIELFKDCAKQFVFISTDFVYDPRRRKFPQPENTEHYLTAGGEEGLGYGYKKRLCELELINGDMKDSNWTILRPCHIYGPTSELGCLPLHGRDTELIDKMLAGKPLQLAGGGYLLQQPIFVDDLAETILSIGNSPGAYRKIFNMAGPDVIESRHYYQIIADVLGVKLNIEEIPTDRFLAENPSKAPFICHRIYNLDSLKAAGLSVPATAIEDGLRLHVNALLRCRENK